MSVAGGAKMVPKFEYKIVQENGQRKCGPPLGWVGPPPPKGCEVFIGKLPRDMFEEELMPLFQQIGTIYEFRLMIDFSGTTRGYAFATYTNKEDARRAIQVLNGYEVRPGKKIGVLKSVDNCKLYIGNIPLQKTDGEVCREIRSCTEGVVKICVLAHPLDHTRNRGFAFVEYESHRLASVARRVLLSGTSKPFGKFVTVDWADPEPEVDEDSLKEVTVLYVRNIPFQIDECYLQNLFSVNVIGSVRKVKKLKDFAFIHYFAREDAEKALNKLNGINLGGQIIEVTWAKPKSPNKSKFYERDVSKQYRNLSGLIPIPSTMHITPVQVLEYICLQNGFGEPHYIISQVVSGPSNDCITFSSKVFISNVPLWEKVFTSAGSFSSPLEAKCCAAAQALKNIGFHNSDPQVPTINQPTNECFPILPRICNPSTLNVGRGMRHYYNHTRTPIIWPDVSSLQSEIETPLNKKCDPDNVYDLLATAVYLASLELQASADKQK